MSVVALREKLTRRPFEPFRVRLSSGDAYDVRHPASALLVRSGIYIAVPEPSGDLPEVPVWCSFLHVAAVVRSANHSHPPDTDAHVGHPGRTSL